MKRPLLTHEEIDGLLRPLNDWQTDYKSLTKVFNFRSFAESIVFVNRIAELAERMDHHPDILISYKTVRLNLTTHSQGGLTTLDFEFAEAVKEKKN